MSDEPGDDSARFGVPPLGRAVATGLVSDSEALIWARVPGGPRLCARTVQGDEAHGQARSGGDGCAVLRLRGLQPDTGYTVRVAEVASGLEVGSAQFHTAPRPGQLPDTDSFSFAVMSCNNPFDEHGELDEGAMAFLRSAHDVLRDHRCRRLLFVGDQVYADQPASRSLFNPDYLRRVAPSRPANILDWDESQVRAMYQQRHRIFLAPAPLQALMSSWASSHMLDDHEIIDNFGACEAHHGPAYSALREGALDAFHDYQGQRVMGDGVRPSSFDHGFDYGPVATWVMDLRSNKKKLPDGSQQFYAPEQLERLQGFLNSHAETPVLLLVLTVPILHASRWLATAGAWLTEGASDADDRWSVEAAKQSRDDLLRMLHAHRKRHPDQSLLLIAGDIHVGMVSEITWPDDTPSLLQLTSSAITNRQSQLLQWAAEFSPHLHTSMDVEGLPKTSGRLLEGLGSVKNNPTGGLNFGLIDFRLREGKLSFRLKLFEEDAERGAKLVYESAEFP